MFDSACMYVCTCVLSDIRVYLYLQYVNVRVLKFKYMVDYYIICRHTVQWSLLSW